MSIRHFSCVSILLSCLALSACMSPDIKLYQPLSTTTLPRTVAVLPFTLEIEREKGESPEIIFRRVFYSYFSYLGYQDLPLDEIDRRLQQAGFTDPLAVRKIPRQRLQQILGVDAVIYGRVLDANNFTAGFYAETRLEAELEFWDLKHRKPLWKLEHHEIDLSGIAQSTIVNMVQDQVNNSATQIAYYKSAEVFSVKAMEKIPDPVRLKPKAVHPPKIKSIRANLKPGQKLKKGDVIKVILEGPKGLKASFDIGSIRTHQTMREIRPGVYRGAYRIREGDRFNNSLIVGRLKNSQGLIGKKILSTLVNHFNV